MKTHRLVLVTALLLAAPPAATGQAPPGRLSIQGALGTNANVGGNTQALSVGFRAGNRVGIFVNAERSHLPTEVTEHEHGSSATRGGTTTFVSGEIQVLPFTRTRVLPYAVAGVGGGVSRPNVNDIFPERVTNDAGLVFFGGGVRVPATEYLSVVADLRWVLQVERQGAGVFLFVPVRGGLAWRF
jgi:hypothetical protein